MDTDKLTELIKKELLRILEEKKAEDKSSLQTRPDLIIPEKIQCAVLYLRQKQTQPLLLFPGIL